MKDVVFDLIEAEKRRQNEGIELIPSENYVSEAVLAATGSVLTNKYSEGYPNFDKIGSAHESSDDPWDETRIAQEILPNYRYYGGQVNIDRIERLGIARACRLFHGDHANLQPHSGANANEAVYFAWCEPGDTILAMSLPAGGHLTHGAPVTRSAKHYNFVHYGVTDAGEIDYEELEKMAFELRPRVILVGYSAFAKVPDFARVAEIAKRLGQRVEVETGEKFEVLLMADMAHVAGLIAGGVHPNPLDFGFQVMTMTTHKTLRGPRGGLIVSRGKVSSPLKQVEKRLENLPTLIDRAVFPGTQGGPLEHVVAAKTVALGEALQPEFKNYAKQVLENAQVLSEVLSALGFQIYGGGTENHMILVDVEASFGIDGKVYEQALDFAGLTLNANALPRDEGGAFRPSGVRLGTPAVTTRGMGAAEMRQIGEWMLQVAKVCQNEHGELAENTELAEIHAAVREMALRFPVPGA